MTLRFNSAFLLLFLAALVIFGCTATQDPEKRDNSDNVSPNISANASLKQAKEHPIIEILECEKLSERVDKEECYETFVKAKLDFKSAKELIEEMDSAANWDNLLRQQCHDIAHAIGRQMYYSKGNSIPQAFDECVQTCHSGCFHGVIQAAFLGKDYQSNYDSHLRLSEMRERVKEACKPLEGEVKNKFQCLHGLGHAIEFYVNNNLNRSLWICDSLETSYDRSSCYGGAFMENVVSVNRSSRWVKKGEPLYPCTTLDDKYKYECYQMQTSIMFELFGEDAKKIIEGCTNAEGGYVNTCFKSFGRDRSTTFRIKKDTAFEDLKQLPEEYRQDYVNGMIYALIDNTWNGLYAFPFCSKLETTFNESMKDSCYRSATNYIQRNLGIKAGEIVKTCKEHAPAQDKDYCVASVA